MIGGSRGVFAYFAHILKSLLQRIRRFLQNEKIFFHSRDIQFLNLENVKGLYSGKLKPLIHFEDISRKSNDLVDSRRNLIFGHVLHFLIVHGL